MHLWRRAFRRTQHEPERDVPTRARTRPHAEGARGDVREANELGTARMFEAMAHEFWTGEEARKSWERNERHGGDRWALAKTLRIVVGNSHMLHAIWLLVSAQVPSEVECPSCGATIRAPHAATVSE